MKDKAFETAAAVITAALFTIAALGPVLWGLDLEYAVVFAILLVGHLVAVSIVLAAIDLRRALFDVSEYQHRSRQETKS